MGLTVTSNRVALRENPGKENENVKKRIGEGWKFEGNDFKGDGNYLITLTRDEEVIEFLSPDPYPKLNGTNWDDKIEPVFTLKQVRKKD